MIAMKDLWQHVTAPHQGELPLFLDPPAWETETSALEFWNSLVRLYPEYLLPMNACPQNPDHHAEGDVGTHTSMVMQQAYQGKEVSWLDRLIFAAAVLHDIGKPVCTREEEGKIVSPGHAKVGEKMAWEFLLREAPQLSFAHRYFICKLVRYHGLPVWFLERGDVRRTLIQGSIASLSTEALYRVAKADCQGRISPTRQDLLDRCELFVEECQNLGAMPEPFRFGNDTSRFLYFRKEDRDAEYVAYDPSDQSPTVYVTIGFPGAGKDTWVARNLPHLPVVSTDAIRRNLRVSFGEAEQKVFSVAHNEAKLLARKGEPFVFNATSLYRSSRDRLVETLLPFSPTIEFLYLDTPLNKVYQRNRTRPPKEQIPSYVLDSMLKKFDLPDLTEAHSMRIIQ
jgi:putative nucleotidyltransferase with HDIG domain